MTSLQFTHAQGIGYSRGMYRVQSAGWEIAFVGRENVKKNIYKICVGGGGFPLKALKKTLASLNTDLSTWHGPGHFPPPASA